MYSRVVHGARISMYVGLITVLLGSVFGGTLGILSAWVGGWFDLLLQRIVDSLAAFPHLVLALIVVTATGRSLNGIILALVLVNTPLIARTLRSAALSIKEAPYVESGRAIGAGHPRLLRLYVLPNIFASVIVLASITVGWAIVVEATLSFLGLGLPPNVPSWGGMLSGIAQRTAAAAPWVAVFPGLALSLTVYGINLLGDGLRDVLDPRLRGG
jgi:peptide/nickel transport system permease protein